MRRRFMAGLTFACIAAVAAFPALAQEKFPTKPIKMVVSFPAGGPTDIVARVMGARMTELLGQQVIIENKPGAGGNLGADMVAKAAPDGYTLLMGTVSTHAINPLILRKIPYDPEDDFEPLMQVGVTPAVLVVNKDVPAKTLPEFVELLKSNPNKFSYGSSGVGSILHLCGESFKMSGGKLDVVHIPYRGSAPMMQDLSSGQIPMAFDGLPTALPQIEAGTVRAIASGTLARPASLPNLPTMEEAGMKGYECYTWNAIFAPAKTPRPIMNKLVAAMQASLADPKVIKRLKDIGVDPTPDSSPEKLAVFMKDEFAKWGPIVKAAKITLD